MATHYLESLLGQNEKVLLATKQHWFILARSIFLEILLILAIFVAIILGILLLNLAAIIIVPIGFVIMLLPVTTMSLDVAKWSNYQFIITNRRVIQISGIFNKNVSDSSLDKLNDVKMTQSFLGRLFGYGDVEIMTASELGVNLFKRIADPIQFKTAMLNAKEMLEHPGAVQRDGSLKEDIPALIANLDQLRKQGTLSEEEFQLKKKELLSKI